MDERELSPMMKQYKDMKQKYKDYILMYRLGDFYEMFFDDAVTASKELDIVLTGRDCGLEERAPMCGVPYHSVDSYISRLVAKGFKVSVCEQFKVPGTNEVSGREVVRMITPGTVTDPGMLDETKNNYIVAVFLKDNNVCLCAADVSTGDVFLDDPVSKDCEFAATELCKYSPREIYCNDNAEKLPFITSYVERESGCMVTCGSGAEGERRIIEAQFCKKLEELALEEGSLQTSTLASLLKYLHDTQLCSLSHIKSITRIGEENYLEIDVSSWRNLEVTETMRHGEKKGSLLGVLDMTETAMGARLLRRFLERPLLNPLLISKRQDAVADFMNNTVIRTEIRGALSGVKDVERLLTKVVYGTANPREIKNLAVSFSPLPDIKKLLSSDLLKSSYIKELASGMDGLQDVARHINEVLCDEPPLAAKDGGIVRDGYSPEVDELRRMLRDSKQILADIEAREKAATGISKLKIGYNKVFGYYIEVSNSGKELVPDTYIRKQTLVNGERYITPELKEVESKLLTAGDRVVELEYSIFSDLRSFVADNIDRIRNTTGIVAYADVFSDLAHIAVKNSYTRPFVNDLDTLDIKNGRHPVVERVLTDGMFIPNDAYLNCTDRRMAIITGPNMSGKSTYMRSVAIIVLMAQTGSFVPASEATIGVTDKIFTRVGASDDLASGQSTFMLEMSEVAYILKNATKKSLLIFDEIGRGTSTFDGMSIARAVLEYVAVKICAKSMFATHYHELTALESSVPGVKNYNAAAKKRGNSVTFLRKIVEGGTDDSYGIDVARLAGVPNEVVRNAEKILEELESGNSVYMPERKKEDDTQISLMSSVSDEIISELKNTDASVLTPIEAMNILYGLSKKAKEI